MKKVMLTVFLLFVGVAVTSAQVTVKFQVNMGAAMFNAAFNPSTDSLTIRGDFQHFVNGGTDWAGFDYKMTRPSSTDSIYSYTVSLDDSAKGKTFNFKYNINGTDAGYEPLANGTPRQFTAPASTSGNLDLPVVYFGNDSSHLGPPLHNRVKFVADLSSILGSGEGFFDANVDNLEVKGLATDWGGPAYAISGNQIMHQNSFTPTQFETDTIIVQGYLGQISYYKYKANPDSDFASQGWESHDNRAYTMVSDTNLQVVPTVVPAISPLQPPITRDVTLTFTVNMSGTITDYNNGYVIPYDSIQFVGLRSGLVGLGDWTSGNWNPSDTANNQLHMRVLHDDGLNGDVTAGDKIWSDTVIIPMGTPGGNIDYKYGVYYGVLNDTANSGATIMDNENAPGLNHSFTLTSNDLTITDTWGTITAIERDNGAATPNTFKLSQNYPNPFNPSTIIQYNLPKSGLVSLKIYDILGREVATLVNGQQVAGVYKVTFDASKLASGVYIYRIISGNFVSTKKMMLLK